jgi:hypothetical protein
MTSHAAGHVALASSLFVALALAIAACGERGGEGPGPRVPGTTAPSASAGAPVAPTAPSASGSAPAAVGTTPPPVGPMRPVTTSAMAEDLKKLGIDPLKPPPLNKLSPDTLRKLMPTFTRALGVKCAACHDTNDFKASTPKKRIASKMWSEYVVGLRLDDGTPLYCDSCHGGKAEMLDRHDKKALSGWMDANYVKKLSRSDKKEQSCEQCHGDPFEPTILEPWAKAN